MHESLAIENISKLPASLRARAKSAADGSWQDLRQLACITNESNGPPPNHSVFLLPLLYIYLDPARIPTPGELDSILCDANNRRLLELRPVTAATISLRAICPLLHMGLVPPAAYADLWPRLYPWIMFMHTFYDLIPPWLVAFGPEENPSTSSVVKKCRGVRLIFAEYWAKIVRSDGLLVHIGMFGHSDGLIDMSQIIIFLVGAGVSSAENWEELLAGVGGRDELAYLLGKKIGIALARPLVDDIAMGLSATLSLIQRTGDDRPFHKAMLSHGVAKALVAAVGALDVYPNRQLVELGKQMGLGALMQHFDDLEDRTGYQWTTQALDGGLLNMVVSMGIRAKEATVFSVDNSYPFLVELLKRILPEALGFYPVVRQMKKSFPVVLPLSTAATFRTAAAFKLWKPFANMVEQRLQALEFFDSGRWISSKACDNLECGKIDDKPKFRRCSGCRSLYYCSAECQKKDWKSGHRKRCRTLRVSREFPTPMSVFETLTKDIPAQELLHPSTPGERAYLRALLQYNWEFLSVKSAVLFLQAQFMYKNPGVEFFTLFDLAKGERDPDWIDIRPMSKFPTGSDDFFRTAQGGRCIQQHAVLMKGLPSPMFRFFPFTFSSSDLNDALLRIVKAIPGLGSSALANHLVGPVSELSSSSEGKEFY